MISRAFVVRAVQEQRKDLSTERINALIDDAVRMLGNLVHYKHRGTHEDDDVVTAVLVIGQDRE